MARGLVISHLSQQPGSSPCVTETGWKRALLLLIWTVLLVGCRSELQSFEPSVKPSEWTEKANDAAPGFRRFIAVRHELQVETAESELPNAWETIGDFCRTLPCEIVASSIRQKTSDSPPSATLSLRIVPEELRHLIEQIEAVGSILEHKTESVDKTATVIDVDAKIKNLTELRDRLRKMVSSSNAGVKEVVEVERELSRAQSELDTIQTTRKALANETEKVFVGISFSAKKSLAETGTLAPIVEAWYSLGHVLAGSIAAAIYFVVAIVPWLVLLIPTLWLCMKALSALRRRRAVASRRREIYLLFPRKRR